MKRKIPVSELEFPVYPYIDKILIEFDNRHFGLFCKLNNFLTKCTIRSTKKFQ